MHVPLDTSMDLDDFDYELPKEQIAQHAITPKDHSRLMVLHDGVIEHRHFYEISHFLEPGDTLVVNQAKVERARIIGRKSTGAKVDILLMQAYDAERFLCKIKSSGKVVGRDVLFRDGFRCRVESQEDDNYVVCFNKGITPELREQLFQLPTPPYIKERLKADEEYQTVYATRNGSLAAPTAGLHFTDELLERIRGMGVSIVPICLDVGFGTFAPVRAGIHEHTMHEETFSISEDAAGTINARKGRLVCVGTTTVRALESACVDGMIQAGERATSIFIYPGYTWRCSIDALITNFHLPRSTLLMLVSAFYGREQILDAYRDAVGRGYRFFSLGDAMLLIK